MTTEPKQLNKEKPKEECEGGKCDIGDLIEKPKHAGGRPTIMKPDVISKLEEVFALGGTDKEACFYANICHQTLYDYQKLHPEFVERKEALKEKPILKARQTVVKALDDPVSAQWYLERKRKSEFGKRDEHVFIPTEKTLEDLLDDYENKNDTDNKQGIDRETAEDKKQAGENSSIPLEHPAELLLGEKKSEEPDTKTASEGTE
jgi:hypothetical protein